MEADHLRELIEAEIRRLDERINHLRELADERKEATEKALELQAGEYDRRLDHANNSLAKLEEWTATTVSLKEYKADEEKQDMSLTLVTQKVIQEIAKETGKEIERARWVAVVAFALSVAGILLKLLG